MGGKGQKLYVYVEESGQDTLGRLFVVGVAVFGQSRDQIRQQLSTIEQKSGKGPFKWTWTKPERRERYISSLTSLRTLRGRLFFQVFKETTSYRDFLPLATANAIHVYAKSRPSCTILVDGLRKSEFRWYTKALRRLGVRVRKVRGIRREESDEFIRLVDALCGLLRDSMEEAAALKQVTELATRLGLQKLE